MLVDPTDCLKVELVSLKLYGLENKSMQISKLIVVFK